MDGPYNSIAVANSFIEKANSLGKPFTLMKLLKLVYFAHGWHLAFAKLPLVNERVEAWKFGPVVPGVYHEFKHHGSDVIEHTGKTLRFPIRYPVEFVEPQLPESEFLNALLERIWDVYGRLSAYQLSELTHRPGTPWYITWHDMGGSIQKGTDIPDNLIRDFFAKKVQSQKR